MFDPFSLPTLQNRTFLVTEGNTGISYMTCLNLVAHNARVYIGACSEAKAQKAVQDIKALLPNAGIRILILDYTSLDSVVKAAKQFKSQQKQLHGLILSGGIMAVPYELTADRFEIQF